MKKLLINIEGTDCSGKGTQTNMLVDNLNLHNVKSILMNFPRYDTPTGKIVGGCYLGKEYLGKPYFPEGATKVDSKVASLFFAADRRYNLPELKALQEEYQVVVLNRYVDSNMAHQASKLNTFEEREKCFEFLEKLEYELLELPKPDLQILLYMPIKYATELKKHREEVPDQHEQDVDYLKKSENAYLELAKRNNYTVINCVENDKILSREQVAKKIFKLVKERLEK